MASSTPSIPKAVAKLDTDWTQLTAFYAFPAEHRRHVRTTNPIASSFATGQAAQPRDEGRGFKEGGARDGLQPARSRAAALRRFNGHELVADVLAGAQFNDGVRVNADSNDNEMNDEKLAA